MLYKSAEKIPNSENPFGIDLLDRRRFIELYNRFLQQSDKSYVLAINGRWGSGKSTLLSMWKSYAESLGIHTIYYNAWEQDYIDDPLVAMLGELELLLNGLDISGKPKNSLFQKIRISGGKILKIAAPIVASRLIERAIDLEKLEDALSEVTEKYLENLVKEYGESKLGIEQFKKSLGLLVANLPKKEDAQNLLFIVDELDRCRPDYSVQLLQRMKHLFLVPGIVFVVAIDREQLDSMLRSVYGNNLDADRYLRRFFDFQVELPYPSDRSLFDTLLMTCGLREFIERRPNTHANDDVEALVTLLPYLAIVFNNHSLRDHEKIVWHLNIAIRLLKPHEHVHAHLLAYLVSLFYTDRNSYLALLTGKGFDHSITEKISADILKVNNILRYHLIQLSYYLKYSTMNRSKLREVRENANSDDKTPSEEYEVISEIYRTLNRNDEDLIIYIDDYLKVSEQRQ